MGTINLFGAKIELSPYLNKPHCFAILVVPKNYYLCADSDKEMNEWMKALQVCFVFIVFQTKRQEAGVADKSKEIEFKKQKDKEDREKRKQAQERENQAESVK